MRMASFWRERFASLGGDIEISKLAADLNDAVRLLRNALSSIEEIRLNKAYDISVDMRLHLDYLAKQTAAFLREPTPKITTAPEGKPQT